MLASMHSATVQGDLARSNMSWWSNVDWHGWPADILYVQIEYASALLCSFQQMLLPFFDLRHRASSSADRPHRETTTHGTTITVPSVQKKKKTLSQTQILETNKSAVPSRPVSRACMLANQRRHRVWDSYILLYLLCTRCGFRANSVTCCLSTQIADFKFSFCDVDSSRIACAYKPLALICGRRTRLRDGNKRARLLANAAYAYEFFTNVTLCPI
jgi:hypothetical protein